MTNQPIAFFHMKRTTLIMLALVLTCQGAADTEITSGPNGGWSPRNGDTRRDLLVKIAYWLNR